MMAMTGAVIIEDAIKSMESSFNNMKILLVNLGDAKHDYYAKEKKYLDLEGTIKEKENIVCSKENDLAKRKRAFEDAKMTSEKNLADEKARMDKAGKDLDHFEITLVDHKTELEKVQKKLFDKEIQLNEKEEKLVKFEAQLQALQRSLTSQESRVADREKTVKHKEGELAKLDYSMANLNQELRRLDNNKIAFTEWEKKLTSQASEIADKESYLSIKEAEVEQKEFDLENGKQFSVNYEEVFKKLDVREADLGTRQMNLAKKESCLIKRERSLEKLELELEQKQKSQMWLPFNAYANSIKDPSDEVKSALEKLSKVVAILCRGNTTGSSMLIRVRPTQSFEICYSGGQEDIPFVTAAGNDEKEGISKLLRELGIRIKNAGMLRKSCNPSISSHQIK